MTKPDLQLPRDTAWLHPSDTDSNEAALVRALTRHSGTGLMLMSDVIKASSLRGFAAYRAMADALDRWEEQPELASVRKAVLTALSDPASPCSPITNVDTLIQGLHQAQAEPVRGGAGAVAQMVRCLLEVDDRRERPDLRAARTSRGDLLVTAPAALPSTINSAGMLNLGLGADRLGTIMFPFDASPFTAPKWPSMRAQDLAAMITSADRELSDRYWQVDRWLPHADRFELSDLNELNHLVPPPVVAAIVAAGGQWGEYNLHFDVLYDRRLDPDQALAVAGDRHPAAVGPLVDAAREGGDVEPELLAAAYEVLPRAHCLASGYVAGSLSASARAGARPAQRSLRSPRTAAPDKDRRARGGGR
jgi:hypothetical protein